MVELMVAMTVGLMLLAGVLQVMSSSKLSYRLADAQVRVHENGRFALNELAKSLRRTRSSGCRSVLLDEHFDTLEVLACDLMNPTDAQSGCAGEAAVGSTSPLGYDASQSGSGNWLIGLPGNASAGGQANVAARWLRGDVLVTWGTTGIGVFVDANGSIGADRQGNLDLAANGKDYGISAGKLALVTDCVSTDIFAVTSDPDDSQSILDSLEHATSYSGNSEAANTSAALSRTYGLTTTNAGGLIETRPTEYRPRVYPFDYDVYFICCMDLGGGTMQTGGGVDNCNTSPDRYRPALCRWSADGTSEQLVNDVVDMRVTFDGFLDGGTEKGLDADFNAASTTRFRDLDGVVTDAAWVTTRGYWDRVDTATVQLLVTGGEPARGEAVAVTNPAPTGPNDIGYGLAADKRLYQVLDLNIAVRSSSPWFVNR